MKSESYTRSIEIISHKGGYLYNAMDREGQT